MMVVQDRREALTVKGEPSIGSIMRMYRVRMRDAKNTTKEWFKQRYESEDNIVQIFKKIIKSSMASLQIWSKKTFGCREEKVKELIRNLERAKQYNVLYEGAVEIKKEPSNPLQWLNSDSHSFLFLDSKQRASKESRTGHKLTKENKQKRGCKQLFCILQ